MCVCVCDVCVIAAVIGTQCALAVDRNRNAIDLWVYASPTDSGWVNHEEDDEDAPRQQGACIVYSVLCV
jgi:hypothetical protein